MHDRLADKSESRFEPAGSSRRLRGQKVRRLIWFCVPLVALVSLAGSGRIALAHTPANCSAGGFDPARIASLEGAGWEAYYARNWLRVFGLMVQMNREQFCMPLPVAVAAAVDIVRAGAAFAPIDNDTAAATAHLERFYVQARRFRHLRAEAKTLAALEMDYWLVHRSLAVERKQAANHAGDIEPMVEALARLHAALFAAPPDAIRRSAQLRAEAARTVDRITGGYSSDIEGDWRQAGEFLHEAYSALPQP